MDRVLPLPAGMRDLLPEEAAHQRMLARTLLERFALFGYRVVTPPAFELAHVVERGLGAEAASDVVRFIEPESGEVAVLRPDMTPQIARIVATRLRDHAPPHRLAYEGTVVRRRSGRAKKHRQIPQVGVELCGVPGDEAELELLELAADALRAVGLGDVTIDLSHAGIVRELLAGAPPDQAVDVTFALAKKDEAMLAERTKGLPAATALLALARLHGGRAAIEESVRLLANVAGGRAHGAAKHLLALFDAASERGLAPLLTADAGEVRGFAYYTGLTFSLYARGPGEPIGAGGRYDELLGRFGAPMAAIGFGFDLDALVWALREAGVAPALAERSVVVVGDAADPRVAALRARGIAAVAVGYHDAALAYARSWGFAAVWNGATLFDVRRERATTLDAVTGSETDADRSASAAARVLETFSRGD